MATKGYQEDVESDKDEKASEYDANDLGKDISEMKLHFRDLTYNAGRHFLTP